VYVFLKNKKPAILDSNFQLSRFSAMCWATHTLIKNVFSTFWLSHLYAIKF